MTGAVAAAVALAPLVALTWGAGGAQAATSVTVASGDGVRLTLGPTGRVSEVSLGGRDVDGGLRPALLATRRVGGTPNLVPNPGLDKDVDDDGAPDGWRIMTGASTPQWVDGEAHSGRRSVRITVPERGSSSTLQTTVAVRPDTYYRLSGWIRSRDVQPTAATAEPGTGPSPVRLKVQQYAGTRLVTSAQAFGYTDTADWHQKFVGFKTRADVTSVRILAQVVDGSGTAWFDDVTLRPLFGEGWRNQLGSVTRVRDGARLRTRAGDLAVDATVRAREGAVAVSGWARSVSSRTVPFQLRVQLPVQATGWTWWDDPELRRTVRASGRYTALTQWTEQQTSRYPWGTVSDRRGALSLGVPLSTPRLVRVEQSGGRLHLTFDLGVSPATTALGGARVPFSAVLFASKPSWGFRGAVAKYQRLFPASFTRRTTAQREGGWFGATDRARIAESWRDFGLGLHMIALGTGNDGADGTWGKDALPWDNERGIYATAYNHHWGYKHLDVDAPRVPSYAVEMGRIRDDAAMDAQTHDQRRRRDRSIASLNSGARDNNGRYLYARYNAYLQHYENLNPIADRLDWQDVSRTYQLEAATSAAAEVGGRLDAIHLDSVSGMRRWGAADDYARAHWAGSRNGLTFSYDSGQVVDRLAMTVAAQVHRVAGWAHARDMILSANFNSSDARPGAWFGAAAIDYVGLERGLPEKAGNENDPFTTVDRFATFKRVLAGQRPVSTIDPECHQHGPAEVEKRFHQTLLYGIYSGCGGQATWTDEQRVVFARYTPLLRELNAVGWEPVHGVRVEAPVRVERFGSMRGDGAVRLVLHNPTAEPVSYDATALPDVLGGRTAATLAAQERISGEPVTLRASLGGVAWSGRLEPHRSVVVRIAPVR